MIPTATTNPRNAIDVLNRLLAAEHAGLIARLGEAAPFVGLPAAADGAIVQRLLADVCNHQRDLTELILRLRGSPLPRRYSTSTGGVHYVKLAYLIPDVIESLRRMIGAYESASAAGHADADALIALHLTDYRRCLAELETKHADPGVRG